MAGGDQTALFENLKRIAQLGARDIERFGQVAFRGQFAALFQDSGGDQRLDLRDHRF